MTTLQEPGRWWHPMNKWLASQRPMTWIFSHTMHHLDPLVFRLSGGHHTAISKLAGLPVIILTTTGARSGEPRAVPLVGVPDGDKIALIASNWGRAYAPGWYYNLRANPAATVTIENRSRTYTVHEAAGDEYERYWQQAVDMYTGYTAYKQRAGRHIPIMVLTPETGPENDSHIQGGQS